MGVQTQLPDPGRIGNAALPQLAKAVATYLKLVQQQMNRLSDGSISGSTTAAPSPPAANSTIIYAQGDYIRNSAPAVTGSPGSQYVVKGWICVAGGTPGTWVQDRGLTGT